MSSLSSWILAACLLGQADPASVGTPEKETIDKAVRELGSTRFSAREAATKFLWQQGRASEAALRAAVESPDREIRTRARKILDDFDFDILPTTPPADAARLREYRDGDLQTRQLLLVDLTNRGRFDMLGQMLGREPSFAVRRLLLISLFANDETANKLIAANQIEKLAERISADHVQAARDALLVELYFSPTSLKRLLATKRGDTFLSLIKKQKTPALRDMMLERLLANGPALVLLSEPNSMATLFDLVQAVEDQQRKVNCLAMMLTNHAGAEWIFTTPYTKSVLKFVHEKIDAESRTDFYQRIFQHDQFMYSWLNKVELKDMLQEVTSDLRGEERATVISQLLFCNVIVKHLEETHNEMYWVTIAEQQADAAARHIFLKQVANAFNFGDGLSHAQECREKLWEFVRHDRDQEWQVTMLATMIRRNFIRLSWQSEPEDFTWLWQLVQGEPTTDRLLLQDWVFRNPAFLQRAIDEGHFEKVVELAKLQGGNKRGALLGIIVGNAKGVEHLQKNNRLDLVFSLVQNSWSSESHNHYLLAVVSCEPLVSALLTADRDEPLSSAIFALKDRKARARIWLALIRRSPMLNRIAEKQQWDKLLVIARDEPDDAVVDEYLKRLFSEGTIVKKMIDQEQYDILFDLLAQCRAKQLQFEIFERLIASRTNAVPLLKQQRAAELMQQYRTSAAAKE